MSAPHEPMNRATVTRDGFTVTVEDDDGGTTIRGCPGGVCSRVGGLGFHTDLVAETWQKVYENNLR